MITTRRLQKHYALSTWVAFALAAACSAGFLLLRQGLSGEAIQVPDYAEWSADGIYERRSQRDEYERGIGPAEEPLHYVGSMFISWEAKELPLRPTPQERADAATKLLSCLRSPYTSAPVAALMRTNEVRHPGETRTIYCAYLIREKSADAVRHRVVATVEPTHGIVSVYVDGFPPFHTAEDVITAVRKVFAFEGELVPEPARIASPRTFKIRSADKKWHFRGGEVTLRTRGDRATTSAVNALRAEIFDQPMPMTLKME